MKSYEALKIIKMKSPGLIKIKRIRVQHLDKIKKRLMAIDLKAPRENNRKKLNLKHDNFSATCTKYGLTFGRWKQRMVKEKWNPEFTTKENAHNLGISLPNAYRYKYDLKLKSAKFRKSHIKRLDNQKIVKFLLANKFTLESIGKMYGVTRERIRQMSLGK